MEEFFSYLNELIKNDNQEEVCSSVEAILSNPQSLGYFLEHLESQKEDLFPLNMTISLMSRIHICRGDEYIQFSPKIIELYYNLPEKTNELIAIAYIIARENTNYDLVQAFCECAQSDDINVLIRVADTLKYVSLLTRKKSVPEEVRNGFREALYGTLEKLIQSPDFASDEYIYVLSKFYANIGKDFTFFGVCDSFIEFSINTFNSISDFPEELTDNQKALFKKFMKFYWLIAKYKMVEDFTPIIGTLLENVNEIITRLNNTEFMPLYLFFIRNNIDYAIAHFGDDFDVLLNLCVLAASMEPVLSDKDDNPSVFYSYGYNLETHYKETCRESSAVLIKILFNKKTDETLQLFSSIDCEEKLFLLYVLYKNFHTKYDFSGIIEENKELLFGDFEDEASDITRYLLLSSASDILEDEKEQILEKACEFISSESYIEFCLGCDMITSLTPNIAIPSEIYQTIIENSNNEMCKNGMIAIGEGCKRCPEAVGESMVPYLEYLLGKISSLSSSSSVSEITKTFACLRSLLSASDQLCELGQILNILDESFDKSLLFPEEVFYTLSILMASKYEPKTEIVQCLAKLMNEDEDEITEDYCINAIASILYDYVKNYSEEFDANFIGINETFDFINAFVENFYEITNPETKLKVIFILSNLVKREAFPFEKLQEMIQGNEEEEIEEEDCS